MKNINFQGNSAQQKAVSHNRGSAMVLAGPGSGKTHVIVWRLKHLIECCGVSPSSILVITFTKAAAIEMQYRFLKITDSSYPEVTFGTFHSVFYQIIRLNQPKSDHETSKIEIATESFKENILRDILTGLKAQGIVGTRDYEDALDNLRDISSEISRLKNSNLTPDLCKEAVPLKYCFGRIFDRYNRLLKEFGRIDFDDMNIRCHELLSENRQLLEKYQNLYEYILIDEYQDINPIQYSIVKLLSERSGNLFVVGDDDQSIYGFRGSSPQIMLDFDAENKIELNINYRCGRKILDAALKVVSENQNRFRKNITADSSNGDGQVVARKYETLQRQNSAIADFIKKRQASGCSIAVIYRTNKQALALAKLLKAEGISTNLENNITSGIECDAVKTCINYISFAMQHKREHFLKIMNKPMRYISRECAEEEKITEEALLKYYKGNPDKRKAVSKLFREIKMLNNLRPALSVRFVRKTIGIDKLYDDEISLDKLDRLENLAAECFSNKELIQKVNEIIQNEKENKDNKQSKANNDSHIKLMTMHGAKGLEFDIVWLPDLNEGILPSRGAVLDGDAEEERRMLYVAMTRAKKALIMSYISGTKENPMLPSRFLRPTKNLWDEAYQSSPSSGSSTISSNSTSSR